MFFLKPKVIISIIVLILIAGGSIYFYFSSTTSGGKTEVSTRFLGHKKIDKLFTAFVVMPLVDIKYGYLKRDILARLADRKSEQRIKGCCYRQYELTFGYNKASELFIKYKKAACENKVEELPEPVILSSNPVSSEVLGNYSRKECDTLDVTYLKARKSHIYIVNQLKKDGLWEKIVSRSQKSLLAFIRITCP